MSPRIVSEGSFTSSIALIYADLREPTSGLEPLTCSLRVIGHVLLGVARVCKSRISKPLSFPWFALCCTVLRPRWYQSGINSGNSCFAIALASICDIICYLT